MYLSLKLIGPFEALLDGQPVAGFQSNKVRGLLAFLAVESGRPHARETLAGLLWPHCSDVQAHHSLNQALSNLRGVLHDHAAAPPFLLVTPQTLQFNSRSDHWLDVEEFGNLVDWHARTPITCESGSQAVELYRGPFLEGLSLADCAAFEEWIVLHRERLHRLAMDALRHLADAYAGLGEYELALRYAWRQIELDPWLEEAHVRAMRWLACAGRRSEALMQYQMCRRLLAQDLGIEPAAETTRLYEQIRGG
jgi:DNA-binding SARP family transcriptional activator